MVLNKFTNSVKDFLQTDIDIYTWIANPKYDEDVDDNEEPLRRYSYKKGKLINFRVKPPYLFFILDVGSGKVREYGFPIPFDIESGDTEVVMDYSLEHLSFGDDKLLDELRKLPFDERSKLYDNQLYVVKLSD